MQRIKDLKNGKFLLRTKTEPDAEGKRYTKNRTVEAKDWNDAERQYRAFIREVAKEIPITKKERDNKKMSVSELLDRYAEAKELEGKSVTYLAKIKNYRKRIDEAFKGRTLADLTVERIDKFSRHLSKCTNRHDEYRYKIAGEQGEIRQINNEYKYQIQALLLSAIKWADKKGYLTDNVTHRVTKLKKGEYEKIEIPDLEVIIDFLEYLDNDATVEPHYKIFMNLAAWCGLRREEILGLRWKNINFKLENISVVTSEVKNTGESRHVKGPKTKGSRREVIIPLHVLNKLKDWKTECNQKRSAWKNHNLTDSKFQDDHVIVDLKDGSLYYPDTFTKWISRYIKNNGFSSVTPQGFRHFYITYMLVNGVDLTTVQDLAGHSNPSITQQIYAAITKEGREKAKAVLNSYLGRISITS